MNNPLDKLNLRPFEKRLIIAVAVILFLVVNGVWVWPHFKDWGEAKGRLEGARGLLVKYNTAIAQKKTYDAKVREFQAEGAEVAAEDQANQFLRTVQNQAAVSHVNILSTSRQATRTNEFFLEQLQTFTVQADESHLVDFLYSLGAGDSIIRARGLSLRPNPPRQQLSGSIDLVASYQKKPATKAAPKKTSTVKKP